DGLKNGRAAGLSQPSETGPPAETGAGRLDQPAGCPTLSVGFGLPAELTAGWYVLKYTYLLPLKTS
ncbi:hypothetical protein Tco_0944137, partial [Tanacetum coccineum]